MNTTKTHSVRGFTLSRAGWMMFAIGLFSAGAALGSGWSVEGAIFQFFALMAFLYIGSEALYNEYGEWPHEASEE